jgi:short subunit dehydrogenase-like uncharacterized protein
MAERDLDILVYGATGFVGRQCVRYLAAAPAARGLRVGLAGRNPAKLEAAREREGAGGAEIVVADAGDQDACDAAVRRARVVLATAGPFARYGTPVVDACVRFGTAYVDITGETWWIKSLIDRYHDAAAAAGTRIIPACGFDSVPSDLGAFFAVRHALGAPARRVNAYFTLFGGVNGGTLASLLEMGADPVRMRALRDPLLLNPAGSQNDAERARNRDPAGARYDADVAAWTAPFFMGPINTRVVRRSAALLDTWGETYGSAFRARTARRGRRGGRQRARHGFGRGPAGSTGAGSRLAQTRERAVGVRDGLRLVHLQPGGRRRGRPKASRRRSRPGRPGKPGHDQVRERSGASPRARRRFAAGRRGARRPADPGNGSWRRPRTAAARRGDDARSEVGLASAP